MKNLLAIVTAFAILVPVSAAFSAESNKTVSSVQGSGVSAGNPDATLAKQKKRIKKKKNKASPVQTAPKH